MAFDPSRFSREINIDQLPSDGEKAACQADADVILRAELMG